MSLSVSASVSGRDNGIAKNSVEAYMETTKSGFPASSISSEGPTPAAACWETVMEPGSTRYSMWKASEKALEIPHFGPKCFDPNPPPGRSPQGMFVNPNTFPPTRQSTNVPESDKCTELVYQPFSLKTLVMTALEHLRSPDR
ncbi:hypothetical protein BKA70DRAFT_1433551 [Coprinopsis sp. MPI-PUGE-AT-0042]|nr:hypothetical protein BKA70DRAFT_1433551 [Coprinopsis sp. MPI-PUGE-AT-0042]